jgi:hypothetical protein
MVLADKLAAIGDDNKVMHLVDDGEVGLSFDGEWPNKRNRIFLFFFIQLFACVAAVY